MNDAEIAATLLNRWQRNNQHESEARPADLLREGGLSFKHYVGVSRDTSNEFADGVEIECLTFDDGSRVIRLTARGAVGQSMRWTAVAP